MSIAPRITQRLMVERSLSFMQAGLGRLAETQEKLSTGRIINRPSDSPTGTNTAMQLRSQLAGNTQYARNAQDGIGWLGRIDNTMSSMLNSVHSARDLIVQGASTGSGSDASRAAIATELKQIRDGLLAQANTTHLGRPIFAGTEGTDVAFQRVPVDPLDPTGPAVIQYVGNDKAVNRTVSDGPPVRVNITGAEAFGPDGSNLFDVLQSAITKLENGTADQLGNDLTALDTVREQMQTTQADAGTRYGRLEDIVNQIKDIEVDLTASLSEVENVDIAKAIVELQMQEVAYQAALGATARVLQPSLIDFLR